MSKVNLIGLSGRIGSGKDTVGAIIQELTRPEIEGYVTFINGEWKPALGGSDWRIRKYAYKLKQIASILIGIPIEKFEDHEFKKSELGPEWGMTVRSFLQKLGTEAVRNGLHDHAWINALFADFTEDSKWIITDVRYPNEYEAIKQRGGIMIRVNRGEQSKDAHISETALDEFKFDYVIDNNGNLDDLKGKVKDVLESINL
jgi:ABC-type oligopeptide transport system ATPase subunit